MPTRILFVDSEQVWRGGQEQVFSLMSGLIQKGYSVYLAAPPEAPLAKRAAGIGIRVFTLKMGWEISLVGVYRFLRLLRRREFHVIHFNTPRPLLAGGIACRLSRVPAVVISRRVNFPLRSWFSSLKYNYLVDQIFTVSASIRETLIKNRVRAEHVKVIYEGVDLTWFDQQVTDLRIDRSAERPLVGVVAHLSAEKGHRTLLEAAAELKKGASNSANFVVVGDGILRNELEEIAVKLDISERVLFLGFRSDAEALMRQFDIFCLPSLSEGLSSAILAAMAAQLPVVATAVGGIPELVQDGVTGLLVVPERPAELSQALGTLLNNPVLCLRMGKAGRQRIESHFTLQQKLDSTERAYQKLLAKSKP